VKVGSNSNFHIRLFLSSLHLILIQYLIPKMIDNLYRDLAGLRRVEGIEVVEYSAAQADSSISARRAHWSLS